MVRRPGSDGRGVAVACSDSVAVVVGGGGQRLAFVLAVGLVGLGALRAGEVEADDVLQHERYELRPARERVASPHVVDESRHVNHSVPEEDPRAPFGRDLTGRLRLRLTHDLRDLWDTGRAASGEHGDRHRHRASQRLHSALDRW
eukprot:scaffold71475_cov67-Phaeocystis_antarctica.AAC.6